MEDTSGETGSIYQNDLRGMLAMMLKVQRTEIEQGKHAAFEGRDQQVHQCMWEMAEKVQRLEARHTPIPSSRILNERNLQQRRSCACTCTRIIG